MTSVRLPREIVHERSVHEKPFTVGQSGSKHPDAPARLLRSHTRALTALARQRDTMQAQGVSHEVMLTTFGSRLIASRNSRPPAAGFGQCPGCTRAHLSAGACVATDQVVTRSDLSFRYRILQYACGLFWGVLREASTRQADALCDAALTRERGGGSGTEGYEALRLR